MAEEYDGTKPQHMTVDAPTHDEIGIALDGKFDDEIENWLKGMRFKVYSRFEAKSPIDGGDVLADLVGRVPTSGKLYFCKVGTEGRERNETSKFIRSKTHVHTREATDDEIERYGKALARYDLGVYLMEHKREFDGMEVY